jgi:DHA2 family multidrug resistance protein
MADDEKSPLLVLDVPKVAPLIPDRVENALLPLILGFSGMVLGQFMAILDIQIVAASLHQIQAGVGASQDEINRIQTAYLTAEVVSIPLASYLSRLWSTRRFYMGATLCFVLASIAAGSAGSTNALIVTRILQGLAAGAMIPQVFATAMTVFPPAHRLTAQVTGATIVTLAPMLGPVIGGVITEYASWRWLFFINAPIGVLILVLVGRYAHFDQADPSLARKVDWLGLTFLALALAAALFLLEDGARRGWFEDTLVGSLAIVAGLSAAAFVLRELTYANPIVSLKPFEDRNFAIGFCLNGVVGMNLFGGGFVLPLFLGAVLGYSALQVGLTLLVSGAVMFLCAPLLGPFLRQTDPRLPLFMGLLITAVGTGLGARINPDWGYWHFALLQSIRSVGVLVSMVAAQQMCVSTLAPTLFKDASGLVNLVRNLGGAVGIALLSALLVRQSLEHQQNLASALNANDPWRIYMLNSSVQAAESTFGYDPEGRAIRDLSNLIRYQAEILAYGDIYSMMAVTSLVGAFLVLAARRRKSTVSKPSIQDLSAPEPKPKPRPLAALIAATE